MGENEIRAVLSHLAVNEHVASSTQNQALHAILFLYRDVLKKGLGNIDKIGRAKRPAKLPVVFTREEVKAVLAQLKGTNWLMASLLYGSGLRVMECVRVCVKDLDFNYNQIVVRDGTGNKDRVTMLLLSLKDPLTGGVPRPLV